MDTLTLRQSIRTCTRCPLHAQCGGPVPPELIEPGAPLVIGEAPDRKEDRVVAPFSGPSGVTLRRWLAEVGLGATRASWGVPAATEVKHPEPRPVNFANTVCCWPRRTPPTPSVEEINACSVNLDATIRYARPGYVLLVGNVALQSFLPRKRIGEWRGFWWKYKYADYADEHEAWMLSTYHPAACLRNNYLTPLARADIAAFAFYSLGHFDPDVGETPGKQPRYWQQERLL